MKASAECTAGALARWRAGPEGRVQPQSEIFK